MCTRVNIIPVPRLCLALLVRRNVLHDELRTALERVLKLVHPRDAVLARGVVDCDQRVPLQDHKRKAGVYPETHLLARRVERIAVAQRNDTERVFHAQVVGMEMAVCDDWVEVGVVSLRGLVLAFPWRGGFGRRIGCHVRMDVKEGVEEWTTTFTSRDAIQRLRAST